MIQYYLNLIKKGYKKMNTPRLTIAESFPELKESLHYLKTHNHHFINILSKYEKIDDKIYRIEDELDILDDTSFENLKKERITLKDQIYNMLINHKQNAEQK